MQPRAVARPRPAGRAAGPASGPGDRALPLIACGLLAAVAVIDDAQAHPQRRAGLWEVRSAGVDALGMPPTRFCVGEQTDTPRTHLDRSPGPRGSCSLGEFVRAGDAWVAESVCREGRSTVTSRAVATGDFRTAYRIDTLVTHDTSPSRREERDAVEARWLGPCEPGQRPGDLVVPGMGTLNMDDGTFRAEPPSRARRGQPAAPPR